MNASFFNVNYQIRVNEWLHGNSFSSFFKMLKLISLLLIFGKYNSEFLKLNLDEYDIGLALVTHFDAKECVVLRKGTSVDDVIMMKHIWGKKSRLFLSLTNIDMVDHDYPDPNSWPRPTVALIKPDDEYFGLTLDNVSFNPSMPAF